jgi:superfamily I DNA/RNA helicase
MSRTHIIFGPPGTGKTTRLVGIVKEYIDGGMDPEHIGFMSFSRQAAKVARERLSKDLKIPEAKLKYVCTLHSIAHRLLKLTKKDVIGWRHYNEIGEIGGYGFDESEDHPTNAIDVQRNGVRCRQIYALARARMTDVETEWRKQNHKDLQLSTVIRFVEIYEQYKESQFLFDFPDMLQKADTTRLSLEVLIIDEAQDLTFSQWQFAQKIGATAKKIIIAGDDDQKVFAWNGADVGPLLSFNGTREFLKQSYRLPKTVHKFANNIIHRVKNRVAKEFNPREEIGQIVRVPNPESVDLKADGWNKEKYPIHWLLLTRCRYGLEIWENVAKLQNVTYFLGKKWSNEMESVRAVLSWTNFCKGHKLSKWETENLARYLKPGMGTDVLWMDALILSSEDREYIRGLRRRGEPLKGPGRVVISTIHSSKGSEAQNVGLLTDTNRMIARNWGNIEESDNELRVIYVSVTRCAESLYLVKPSRTNFYAI